MPWALQRSSFVHKVRVWDLPTRLFHWALVLCILGLVISGNVGGNAMAWHFRLGYAVLTLLLFRVVWGVVGGYWSRFSTFIKSPGTVWKYLRGEHSPLHSVGHNPLGALSVVGLIFVSLAQVAAGLMSDDEIANAGPLVAKVPSEWVSLATAMHTEVTKVILIVLVVLHVLAILWYRFKKQENLIQPMITGDKHLAMECISSKDTTGSRLFALGILVMCGGLVAALLRWAA